MLWGTKYRCWKSRQWRGLKHSPRSFLCRSAMLHLSVVANSNQIVSLRELQKLPSSWRGKPWCWQWQVQTREPSTVWGSAGPHFAQNGGKNIMRGHRNLAYPARLPLVVPSLPHFPKRFHGTSTNPGWLWLMFFSFADFWNAREMEVGTALSHAVSLPWAALLWL